MLNNVLGQNEGGGSLRKAEQAMLAARAGNLVDNLVSENYAAACDIINQIMSVREDSLYQQVGGLTRGLHNAIVNFQLYGEQEESSSDMSCDARVTAKDSLDYVIALTQNAANKTMDMVEEGVRNNTLSKTKIENFKTVVSGNSSIDSASVIEFLDQLSLDEVHSQRCLQDILLAQDYQDLTGQVIKKVIGLVQDVEDNLVSLMRVASDVENMSGGFDDVEAAVTVKPMSEMEGPQLKPAQRNNIVSGQDDVDDLLSSLGF